MLNIYILERGHKMIECGDFSPLNAYMYIILGLLFQTPFNYICKEKYRLRPSISINFRNDLKATQRVFRERASETA